MEQATYFLAVDLGATSGRTVIGTLSGGRLTEEELTRFDNVLIETGGHCYWDLYALYHETVKALQLAARRHMALHSIGIDTWGCDVVCIDRNGALLRNPLSYRDPHTQGMMEHYFSQHMPRHEVYDRTGIQFMPFNTLFQLYAMRREGDVALSQADKVLFIPDALGYMLTGQAVCEYTVASTSQLLNPLTADLDPDLLATLQLQRRQFGPMTAPGTVIGTLTPEVQRLTGLGAVPVVAVAGHDTASAVAAVPAADAHFAYLSSGTWSLMGIESPQPLINARSYSLNFTNEGGIDGSTRVLKNICGMWLYECCRKEWTEAPASHAALQAEALQQPAFRSLINPDDPLFAHPASMVQAIQQYCRRTGQPVPEGHAAVCRCIFDSLALRYRQVLTWLQELSPFPVNVLHIIGGGSLNDSLNQFTADSCGVTVLAGPQECTALGNILLQARAAGLAADVWEMRRTVRRSVPVKRFLPHDRSAWDDAYGRFLRITEQAEATA